MIKLFTDDELNLAKSNDLLPIECIQCGKVFYKTKRYIKNNILNPDHGSTGDFCSNSCSSQRKKNNIIGKICPRCGNIFEISNNSKQKKYCSDFCSHRRQHTDETKIKLSISVKNSEKSKKASLERKIKDNELIFKKCPICGSEMKLLPSEKNKIYCSKACYNKDYKLEYRKKSNGGVREGSGRGKSGWYKGYYCNSSYELAFVIYNIDNNISFIRNLVGFDYLYLGETHKYFPDFIIDDVYYEIKGFLRGCDKLKFAYFPHKLKIMLKNDLVKIFDYVKSKYGNNFIELYDGNPHKIKNNICKICGEPAKNIYCSRKCSGIDLKNKK